MNALSSQALARAAPDLAELRARRAEEAQAVLARATPRRDLLDRLGPEAAARVLRLPPTALAQALEEPRRRRRLCERLAIRLGADQTTLAACLDTLPTDHIVLQAAGYLAALTLALADAPRILPRTAYTRLAERFGPQPLDFALACRGPLRGAPDAGDGAAEPMALLVAGPALLVAALEAVGDPAASLLAALVEVPPAPEGGPRTPRDGFAEARAQLVRHALAEAAARAEASVGPEIAAEPDDESEPAMTAEAAE